MSRGGAGKLLVIWDGAPIHHDHHGQAFLAGEAGAVHVEQLPGYVPGLNTGEVVGGR